MKSSVRKMAVALAIVMSLVVVQSTAALAATTEVTVTGVVTSINLNNNTIDVLQEDGGTVTVSCIPLTYLNNKGITIDGQDVVIQALLRTLYDGSTKYIAVSLTVNGKLIPLPGKNPKR
jgi:hypothetical protein